MVFHTIATDSQLDVQQTVVAVLAGRRVGEVHVRAGKSEVGVLGVGVFHRRWVVMVTGNRVLGIVAEMQREIPGWARQRSSSPK